MISSEKYTRSAKRTRLFIALEQKFDMTEQQESCYRNSKIGRNVVMPSMYGTEYYKTLKGNKGKVKVATAFCGLQTSTRNRSVPVIEIWGVF